MRTKNQIRNGEATRKILGIALMGLGIIMLVVGYLCLEFKPEFIQNMIASSKTILIIIAIIWFAGALGIYTTGLFVILNYKIRHHEYTQREHSSLVD